MNNKLKGRFIDYVTGVLFIFTVALSGPASAKARGKKTLALLPFQNLTGDKNIDWIGEGIPTEMGRKLSFLKGLEILPRRDLQSLSAKMADPQIHTINPPQLTAILKVSDADYVIAGGYQRSEGKLLVSLYIISSMNQKSPFPLEIRGEVRSIFTLINDLIQSMLPSLGITASEKENALLMKNQTEKLNAFVYYSRSLITFLKDDLDTTITYCKEAIEADPYYDPALNKLIEIYERLEKWSEATKICQILEKIAKKKHDNIKLMAVYEKYIRYHSLNNNPLVATKYDEFIVDLLLEENDLEGVYKKYTKIAENYLKRGMRDQPVKYYLKALEVQKELKNYQEIGNTYHSLGVAFVLKKTDWPALRYFEKALAVRKKNRDQKSIPYTLTSIAEIELRRRKYPKAKKYLKQAMRMAEENTDKPLIARIHNNYGLLNFYESKFEKALEYYERALSFQEKTGDPNVLLETYDNIGTIYSNEDNYEKAIIYLQKSLALRKKAGMQLAVGQTSLKIANIFLDQKKFDEALKIYKEAYTLLHKGGDKRDIALIYFKMGNIYEAKKEFDKALLWYQNAVQVQRILEDNLSLAGTFFHIGQVYEKTGLLEKAIRYIEKTVALDRKNRDPNIGDDQRYLRRLKKKLERPHKKEELDVASETKSPEPNP